eukprot:361221-Chlamydomonas_euryale.AAC.9
MDARVQRRGRLESRQQSVDRQPRLLLRGRVGAVRGHLRGQCHAHVEVVLLCNGLHAAKQLLHLRARDRRARRRAAGCVRCSRCCELPVRLLLLLPDAHGCQLPLCSRLRLLHARLGVGAHSVFTVKSVLKLARQRCLRAQCVLRQKGKRPGDTIVGFKIQPLNLIAAASSPPAAQQDVCQWWRCALPPTLLSPASGDAASCSPPSSPLGSSPTSPAPPANFPAVNVTLSAATSISTPSIVCSSPPHATPNQHLHPVNCLLFPATHNPQPASLPHQLFAPPSPHTTVAFCDAATYLERLELRRHGAHERAQLAVVRCDAVRICDALLQRRRAR